MFITTLVSSLLGIVIFATINSMANTGLTGGQVVLYGLGGGILIGIFTGSMVTYLIIKKVRKLILDKLAGTLGRFGFLRRM